MQSSEGHDEDSKPAPLKRKSSYGYFPPTLSGSSTSPEETPTDSSATESSLGDGELPAESVEHHEDDNTKETVSSINPAPDTLRIALVGKTGSGKSSTGNTILGKEEFKAKLSSTSITKRCSKAEADVDERRVAVVDTPGLFDTSVSNEDIIREASKSISLLAPGPHAFLLLIQIGRFTAEEKGAMEYIKAAFGKGAEKYIMVLFTHGDKLEDDGMSIEEYVDGNSDLKSLISENGNGFHVFNNKKKDPTQVKELLEKINIRVTENGGGYYTNEMLQKAEAAIQEEMDRIMKDKEEEMRREREKIERKYQREMELIIEREKQRQEDEIRKEEEKIERKYQLEMEKLKIEKQRQEEEKEQMARQLREKEEQIQKEQELREREMEEIVRRRTAAVEHLNWRYRQAARTQAETSHPFFPGMWTIFTSRVLPVIGRFYRR